MEIDVRPEPPEPVRRALVAALEAVRAEQERGTLRLARGRTIVLDTADIAQRARAPSLDRA